MFHADDPELGANLAIFSEKRHTKFLNWHDTLYINFKRKVFWRWAVAKCDKNYIKRLLRRIITSIIGNKLSTGINTQKSIGKSSKLILKNISPKNY